MKEMKPPWGYEENILRPSVMEIDLDAILHNLKVTQQRVKIILEEHDFQKIFVGHLLAGKETKGCPKHV